MIKRWGINNGCKIWYAVRHWKFKQNDNNYFGTYKSNDCIGFTYNSEIQACQFCSQIHSFWSFKKQLQRCILGSNSNQHSHQEKGNDYLTQDEEAKKLTQQAN